MPKLKREGPERATDFVESLDRGLRLLQAFGNTTGPMTLSDLARAVVNGGFGLIELRMAGVSLDRVRREKRVEPANQTQTLLLLRLPEAQEHERVSTQQVDAIGCAEVDVGDDQRAAQSSGPGGQPSTFDCRKVLADGIERVDVRAGPQQLIRRRSLVVERQAVRGYREQR